MEKTQLLLFPYEIISLGKLFFKLVSIGPNYGLI